jgi:O-methyltransferase domain
MTQAKASPHDRMSQALDGYLTTQLAYVAAELGIADVLQGGPRSTSEIAALVGAEPKRLRGLVVEHVLTESDDDTFRLTAVGELLPAFKGAARVRARLYSTAAAGLLQAVRDGGTPFDHVFGRPFFQHLDGDAEDEAAFQASMAGRAEREAHLVVAAYNFAPAPDRHVIVDVGGGNGVLLATILAAAPHANGVLLDRSAAVHSAQAYLESLGLAERVRCTSGDFFESVPAGGDTYLLSRVLHDWEDEDAVRILRCCRQATDRGARLVIVDVVLPDRALDAPEAIRLDLNMLVLFGSRERTENEFAVLLERTGFRLRRVVPTGMSIRLSVIEGIAD